MPQNEFIEEEIKRRGRGAALQIYEKLRKKKTRLTKNNGKMAKKLFGIKAKLFAQKRFKEKVELKKKIKEHQEKMAEQTEKKTVEDNKEALPSYLLDRENVNRSKILSNTIKQKRKEKAGRWSVPIPKVQALSEDQMFKVLKSGKRKKKQWKRMINKVSFVGEDFTRKPPKYERFIRPMGLRFKSANVSHPELKTTFQLPILSVKRNPQNQLYTTLGVITKGTIVEVNVSELGLVTPSGKVIWGKYAQVTNDPELDGCINAVLLT